MPNEIIGFALTEVLNADNASFCEPLQEQAFADSKKKKKNNKTSFNIFSHEIQEVTVVEIRFCFLITTLIYTQALKKKKGHKVIPMTSFVQKMECFIQDKNGLRKRSEITKHL